MTGEPEIERQFKVSSASTDGIVLGDGTHEFERDYAYRRGKTELFKFRPFSTPIDVERVADILIGGRVRFSFQDQLNDPFDMRPRIVLGGDLQDPEYLERLRSRSKEILLRQGQSPQQVAARVREMEADGFKDLTTTGAQVALNRIATGYPVFSLAGSRTEPLLWSHYASGHQGLCIHFGVTQDSIFSTALAVHYAQSRAELALPLELSEYETCRRVLLWKGQQWKYEDEYRLIKFPGLRFEEFGIPFDGQFMQFRPERISGVSLGIRMPAEKRHELLLMVKNRKPALPVWIAEPGDEYEPTFRPGNIAAADLEAAMRVKANGAQ